jgi:AcrR family transcriptional regulator
MATASRSPTRRIDRRTRSARAEGRDGRHALLDAAAEVFARRGFRDASVDEIAERAGYSKGAVYWHFSGKDDLFFALLDERIDRPIREAIAQLESAPAEQDMSVEASQFFGDLLRRQRDLLLLEQEYWSQAVRDPKLRARYAKRQAELRTALGRAMAVRLEHLGAPPFEGPPENMATAVLSLTSGLLQAKLIDPAAVPDELIGNTFAMLLAGHVARSA